MHCLAASFTSCRAFKQGGVACVAQRRGSRSDSMTTQTYTGACHCGAVRFEADLDLTQPSFRCNCSICRRTRFWPAVATPDRFRLLAGQSDLTEYLFNTRKNQHFFCRHCGVRAFGIGNETPIGKMIGVNIGCLEGVSEQTLSKIPIVYVDGMHDRPGEHAGTSPPTSERGAWPSTFSARRRLRLQAPCATA